MAELDPRVAGLPPLPPRQRAMFCTKCGYSGETAAQMPHAPCENRACGYMAFVSEKDFSADQLHEYGLACRATLAPGAPAGFKLVPVKVTKAMQDAWDSAPSSEDSDADFAGAYQAMLDAAPGAPGQEAAAVQALTRLTEWAQAVHPDVNYSGDHPIAVARRALGAGEKTS